MLNLSRYGLAVAVVGLLALTGLAQSPNQYQTTITIPEMECQGCAKKIADKLYAVPGVGTVQANVQSRILLVTPRPQTAISPRQIWEAIEAAGKNPTKLQGPNGTFTTKPQA